jgi:hypothetical protein
MAALRKSHLQNGGAYFYLSIVVDTQISILELCRYINMHACIAQVYLR